MSKQMSRQQTKQLTRQQTRQAQRRERKEELRRRELARQAARRRTIFFVSIAACAVIIAGIIIGINLIHPSTTPSSSDNSLHPNVDNISCNPGEQLVYHVHAHLTIYKDGQPVSLAQNIGIPSDNTCIYWLHTHDTTGVIHIETPQSAGYKLGTFIKLWREEFPDLQYPTQLSATNGWKAYVDGKAYNGDFNNIELKSHELITLAYNSPDITPDKTYSWPSDLAQ
jgi:hypothetical protein